MSSPYSKSSLVVTALAELEAGRTPARELLRDAVRELLAELARKAPGRSVEVRVPPYGAVQCGSGPRHTRGTPANVVEMEPATWILLATGRLSWADAIEAGRIRASGNRADISPYIPLD
ncbi:sterol carrier family protein [Micromonospora sp. NPDC050397]|uniref:sterol carrier family protein n=1 Tax=Micromonospora sp. NPDC050397 TaxID=3364279 RepID=UPI00384F6E94